MPRRWVLLNSELLIFHVSFALFSRLFPAQKIFLRNIPLLFYRRDRKKNE